MGNTLSDALKYFEVTEANIVKAEKLMDVIIKEIPESIVFCPYNKKYETACANFLEIWEELPLIDNWKPEVKFFDFNEISLARIDYQEIGEFSSQMSFEEELSGPERFLDQYKLKLSKKRYALIKKPLIKLVDNVDNNLNYLKKYLTEEYESTYFSDDTKYEELKQFVGEIIMLLGSSLSKAQHWSNMNRHLHFGMRHDLHDIVHNDWPSVKKELIDLIYDDVEPIPVKVHDLGEVVNSRPSGPITTKLKWETLDHDDFERLIFTLISSESGYENPEWLMKPNAPDKGRDLSVYRVINDSLSGVTRLRVIIQCKHWLSKSVAPSDISLLKEQMSLWNSPRVDICIIATSGRFTSDAIQMVENHNQSDLALKIELWPESHLERLLCSRPGIITQFSLR